MREHSENNPHPSRPTSFKPKTLYSLASLIEIILNLMFLPTLGNSFFLENFIRQHLLLFGRGLSA